MVFTNKSTGLSDPFGVSEKAAFLGRYTRRIGKTDNQGQNPFPRLNLKRKSDHRDLRKCNLKRRKTALVRSINGDNAVHNTAACNVTVICSFKIPK